MTRYIQRLFFAMAVLCLPLTAAHAQERLTQVSLISAQDAVIPGEDQWLGLRINIAPDWHVYWVNPGDSGLKTSLTWQETAQAELGPLHWPVPKALPFDFLTNYGYENEVILPIPLRYDGDSSEIILSANVDLLVCKDICIPESAGVSLTLPVAKEASPAPNARLITNALQRVPSLHETTGQLTREAGMLHFALPLSIEAELESVEFFPLTDQLIENSAEREWEVIDTILSLKVAAGNNTDNDVKAVLRLRDVNSQPYFWQVDFSSDVAALSADVPEPTPSSSAFDGLDFITALLFAFLGGIILNAMPCVFPILSLKALSVAKYSDQSNARVRLQGVAYTAGILAAFAAIVVPLIALQQAGESVGWGFQLQSPAFVGAMILIIFAVGLSLSGMFHMPSGFSGAGPKAPHSLRGSFLTGVLATLVATPCTGPFMAPALGFALAQPAGEAFIIFQALGLGLAFPYLLISFVPATRALLPKPGIWMERLKEFLAFPMYATAAWLLWVLVQQTGANGMFWVVAAAIMLALALWSLKLRSSGWKTLFWILAIVMSVLALVKQDSAPPMKAMEFSTQQIETLRVQNKPVFVYATAAWCVTCKINENVALNTQSVQAYFAQENIEVIMADWTNKGPIIADYLQSFGRSGVPLYVFYPAGKEPVLLPQLLTPSVVIDAIEKAK